MHMKCHGRMGGHENRSLPRRAHPDIFSVLLVFRRGHRTKKMILEDADRDREEDVVDVDRSMARQERMQ
jgi:hypothetical protein